MLKPGCHNNHCPKNIVWGPLTCFIYIYINIFCILGSCLIFWSLVLDYGVLHYIFGVLPYIFGSCLIFWVVPYIFGSWLIFWGPSFLPSILSFFLSFYFLQVLLNLRRLNDQLLRDVTRCGGAGSRDDADGSRLSSSTSDSGAESDDGGAHARDAPPGGASAALEETQAGNGKTGKLWVEPVAVAPNSVGNDDAINVESGCLENEVGRGRVR